MYQKSLNLRFWLVSLCLIGVLFLLNVPRISAWASQPLQANFSNGADSSAIGTFLWEESVAFGVTLLNIAPVMLLAAFLGGLVAYRHAMSIFDRDLFQAHILLSVSGALMMLIVGNELVRAFGLLGAASVVRYRYKLQDPRDASRLIIALGVGMAAGAGLYALAVSAAVVVAVFAQGLSYLMQHSSALIEVTRPTTLKIHTTQPEIMLARVQRLLTQRKIPARLKIYRLLTEKTAQDEPVYQLIFTLRLDADDSRFECTTQLSHKSLVGLEWETKK